MVIILNSGLMLLCEGILTSSPKIALCTTKSQEIEGANNSIHHAGGPVCQIIQDCLKSQLNVLVGALGPGGKLSLGGS